MSENSHHLVRGQLRRHPGPVHGFLHRHRLRGSPLSHEDDAAGILIATGLFIASHRLADNSDNRFLRDQMLGIHLWSSYVITRCEDASNTINTVSS